MIREQILGKCLINYDEETLLMFRNLLHNVYKTKPLPINIVEYGVWQGGWLYNLVLYAKENNIEIYAKGYDTFEYFPIKYLQHEDCIGGITKESTHFARRVENFPYKTLSQMKTYLPDVTYIKGDILHLEKNEFSNGDIVYLDLDMYAATKKVLDNLTLDMCAYILFDDYEHKFWRGATSAINELLNKNPSKKVIPLYEYLSFNRTNRSKDIYVLVNK